MMSVQKVAFLSMCFITISHYYIFLLYCALLYCRTWCPPLVACVCTLFKDLIDYDQSLVFQNTEATILP